MLPNEAKDVVLRLLDGRSEQRELVLRGGRERPPFAVGHGSAWRVEAGHVGAARVRAQTTTSTKTTKKRRRPCRRRSRATLCSPCHRLRSRSGGRLPRCAPSLGCLAPRRPRSRSRSSRRRPRAWETRSRRSRAALSRSRERTPPDHCPPRAGASGAVSSKHGSRTPAAARGPPGVGRDRRAPDVALRSGAFATPRRARTPRSRATRSARRALPWLPRPSRRRPIRLRKAQRRPRRPRARRPTGRSRRPWACTRRAPRSDARSTPWPRASTARPPISTKRSPRLTARTLRSAKLRASCAREAGRRVNEAGPRGALDAGSRAPMPSNSPSQRSNRGACLRGKAARPVAMNKGPEARSDVAEPSPGPASRASRPVLATSRRRRFQGPIRRRIARGVRSSGAAQHAGRCTGGRRWCRSQRACVDDRRCVGDGRSSTTADVVAAATTAVGGVVPVGRRLANERRRRTARARRGGRGARSRSPS